MTRATWVYSYACGHNEYDFSIKTLGGARGRLISDLFPNGHIFNVSSPTCEVEAFLCALLTDSVRSPIVQGRIIRK